MDGSNGVLHRGLSRCPTVSVNRVGHRSEVLVSLTLGSARVNPAPPLFHIPWMRGIFCCRAVPTSVVDLRTGCWIRISVHAIKTSRQVNVSQRLPHVDLRVPTDSSLQFTPSRSDGVFRTDPVLGRASPRLFPL